MTTHTEHEEIDGVEQKKCCSCQTFKPLENFGNYKKSWDKLYPICKPCLKKTNEQNKEIRSEYNKKYWQETKEEQKKRNKEWRKNNPEKVKQAMSNWLENNKEHKKEIDKKYRKEHREQYNQNHARYVKEQYHKLKNDPERTEEFTKFKIQKNMSRRLREILGQDKSERCMDYVGCSLDDFKKHIESTMTDDMSWENYGTLWHIDHIIPCVAFDATDPFELKVCWHFSNLRALDACENIRKKGSYSQEEKDQLLKKLVHLQPLQSEPIC